MLETAALSSRAGCATGAQAALNLARERGVVFLSRPAKLFHHPSVCSAVDVLRGEDARLSADAFDLCFQPLEVFARIGRIRQDVHRLFDHERANLLQPPPDAHADVGRLRR